MQQIMNDPFDVDYGADATDAPVGPTAEQLADLNERAIYLARLQARIARGEELLKQWKAEEKQKREVELPDAMIQAGALQIPLTDGGAASIETVVVADVLKANRDRWYDWLEENGHGSIVKKLVAVSFGRGEKPLADELADYVLRHFPNRPVEFVRKVETQTQLKFIREMYARGEVLPDVCNVTELRQVKITPPKRGDEE